MCKCDEYMDRFKKELKVLHDTSPGDYSEFLADPQYNAVQINIEGDNHAPITF